LKAGEGENAKLENFKKEDEKACNNYASGEGEGRRTNTFLWEWRKEGKRLTILVSP